MTNAKQAMNKCAVEQICALCPYLYWKL